MNITTLKTSIKNLILSLQLIWNSSRSCFVLNAILDIIAGILVPINLYVWKNILDNFTSALVEGNIKGTINWVILNCIIAISQNIIKLIANYFKDLQVDFLNLFICNKVQSKLIELEMDYYDNHEQYNNLTQINEDALNKSISIVENISLMLQYLVSIFGIANMLWKFNSILIILSIISYIPAFLISIKITENLYLIYESRVEKLRLVECLKKLSIHYENIKEIKIYSLGKYIKDKIIDIYKSYIQEDKIIRKGNLQKKIGANILQYILSYGIKLYIIVNAIILKLSIGSLTMYINATDNFQQNIGDLLCAFSELHKDILYVNKFLEFIGSEENVQNNKKIRMDMCSISIKFEHVYFKYPNSNVYILEDINFEIKSGVSYLLVGLNGSGKTTLVKLLCGLYKPSQGNIFLNGRNIFEYDLEEYRKKIGVVFQDFIKFPLSVKENIQVGNYENNSETRLINSAISSGASEFIYNLKNRYDTILQNEWNDGTEISLGQWQKIAISRALYANPDFLIMDEPTASIDAQAENDLYNKIRTIIENKTCLIISHRFSTATIVDRIMVLEKGRIVEEGTFTELLNMNGSFAYLFNMQSERYKINEN